MALSSDIISQFIKATNDKPKASRESTVYGTVEKIETDGNTKKLYVRIDGADQLTPVLTTTNAVTGDRVAVQIKDHMAIATGNTSEGGHSVRTDDLTKTQDDVGYLQVNKLDAESAKITYATIENLNAVDGKFENLDTKYAKIEDLEVVQAEIDNLNVENLDATYANIDFTNIGKAAMEYFYSKSGLIDNVVVGDQTITGELIGVTISGDRLVGNTVVAEKLVIKGSDGLYYKLNTDGMKIEAQQTDENSLNGQIIKAKSVTATKISVDDLVAFDATIGGFNITESSIYSGVKESINNTTRGIYLDKDGQMFVGDSNNYIKYYKDTDGSYKLAISTKSLQISTGTDVETAITELQNGVNNIEVGGANIVENSDFSSDTIGPWRNWGDATSGTRERVEIDTHPRFTSGITVNKTSAGQWGYAQDNIPLMVGETYILSAWFKVNSGDSNVTLMCQQGTTNDGWTDKQLSITEAGDDWYRLYHKFTAKASATNIYIGIQGNGSANVSFTGVQLEKGNVLTDWSPYAENVRIGGTNLLRGTRDFNNVYWVNNGCTLINDTIEGGGLYTVSAAWNDMGYKKLIDLEIELNADYTISWYAKASSDVYLPKIQFYCTDGATHIVTRYGSSYERATTTEWKRYSHTFRFKSAPTASTELRIEPSTNSVDPTNAYIIIGAFKLEKGNKATDWTPAPEDLQNGIDDAAKTATNYLNFSSSGLVVGDMTATKLGKNVLIDPDSVDIRNDSTVLASFGASEIDLGKNSSDSVVKMCGGKGQIEYAEDYLQLSADSVRLKGKEMASLYSNYTDSNGIFRNGAVHASPGEVSVHAGGGSDDSSITVKPTNISMTTDNFYLSGVMNDSDNGGTYVSATVGTSGNWTYKKYADGYLEMWGSYAISNLACTTAIGNMFRTNVFSPSAFPFTIYNPHVIANYESEGYGAFLWATTNTTTAKPPNYYLVRPTSTTIANGKIIFHVRGRWKT